MIGHHEVLTRGNPSLRIPHLPLSYCPVIINTTTMAEHRETLGGRG